MKPIRPHARPANPIESPAAPPAPAALPRRRLLRGIVVGTAVFNLLFGILLVSTTWTKAFGGTGGEDTTLFQLVSSALLAMIALGALALALAIRPRLGLVAVLGAGLIVVGILLFLFTLFFLGIPEIALGIAVLLARPRPKRDVAKGPPRGAFAGSAAFNLFFGTVGFITVGIPAFTGTAADVTLRLLGFWSVAAIILGALALVLAIRPLRQPAVALGIVLIGLGVLLPVILLPVIPLAIVEIVLGALVLRAWKRL